MAVHGRQAQGADAVLRSVDGVRTGEDLEDLRS
jgi:hypothetical protein